MRLRIFQTDDPRFCFQRFDFAIEHGFDEESYTCVWDEEIDDNIDNLDDVFERFNLSIPNGFPGRSLSVSDIVEVDGRKYYIDAFGYKEL